MAHSKHRAIRAAVAALLTSGTALAGGRVYENRAYPLAEGVASQIHVNYVESQPAPIGISGAPVAWATTIEIQIKARASADSSAEDVADALWTDVYARVMAGQQLGGLAAYVDPGAMESQNDQADTGVCRLTWSFVVQHDTSNNSIEA
jgi:hypothetical protein